MVKSTKKKSTEAPDYRNNPTGFSVTVYDIQGDPISPEIQATIVSFIENLVKGSKVNSLAIDVRI